MKWSRSTPDKSVDTEDDLLVHNWRAGQLKRLGVPVALAEAVPTGWTGIRSPR